MSNLRIYGELDDTIVVESDDQRNLFYLTDSFALVQIGDDVLCRLTYNDVWYVEYFYLRGSDNDISIHHMDIGQHKYSSISEMVVVKNIEPSTSIVQLV